MADFTAVIRRAVEGLPDNTPELRARVYEKARTAVIRQMENMNPRPPEALVKRQIDKIDAAIAEVESEFAEALPPEAEEDEPPVEPVETFETPAAAEEPSSMEDPADEPRPEDEPDPAPSYYRQEEDDASDEPDAAEEPAYQRAADYEKPHPEGHPVFGEEDDAEEPEADADDVPPSSYRTDLHESRFEPVSPTASDEQEDEPEALISDDAYVAEEWDNQRDAYSFDRQDEPLDDEAGHVAMSSDDDPDVSAHQPSADDDDDEEQRPIGDWSFEATAASTGPFEPAPPPPRRPVPEKDWAHVDSLLGLEPEEHDSGYDDYSDDEGAAPPPHVDEEKGRRKGLIMAVAGLVVVVILAVGGYFGWSNRDSLVALISPADVEETQTQPDGTASQPETTPSQGTQETASAETKPFTQRLLPDGNEVDEGLPPVGAASGPAVTVASQTTGSSAPSTAPSGQAASEPAPPVGAAQRMYLYEEQLGQSVPSSYQGTVEWELKQENNGTDVPEPVIEGTLSVPEAGLAGTITFRRNDDPSLPASHLVDIAFTLSDNFEGGAIENVQRISMKNTEAARGDPLVAVSAKITDDLYMLALNDFEQARAQNLALLRDRNWIDIPVTYRNGRRALLTLEKGTTGMAIFDRAIQEWQALGDINATGN